jgi:copper chaperone NosL
MKRRAFLLGAVFLAACKKEERCSTCGMKIDRTSPWRAEIVLANGEILQYDTPRCAIRAWTTRKIATKTLRVQEYYDRNFRDGAELRFVAGGDVVGPMGPDLVPVDPSRVTKYIQDHSADRAYMLSEITPEILKKLGRE